MKDPDLLIPKVKEKIASKLNIKIGEKIDSGHEGIIYEIPGNRVIKISLPHEQLTYSQNRYKKLENKKFNHIVNIYHVGIFREKSGLLFEYIIMERLYPLKNKFKFEDFINYTLYDILRDNDLFAIYDIEYTHREDILDYLKTFVFLNNIDLIEDFRDTLLGIIDSPEHIDTVDQLIDLLLEMKKYDIDSEDFHINQFAKNKYGVLKLIDVAQTQDVPGISKNYIKEIYSFEKFTKLFNS
jgi:hypothetical protein